MEIVFSSKALDHLDYWKKRGNKKIIEKIKRLVEDIQLTPFEGIGKPEALKYDLAGYWSRRITDEHRIVYKVEDEVIFIAQLRFHY